MRRTVALSFLIIAASCVHTPPPTAPAPRNFHGSRNAKEATQAAVIMLMTAGFRVSQTDSLGQAVTASRTATRNGNEEYVACELPRGAAAVANRETTLTINFHATQAATGSDVTVDSHVLTSYPGYQGTSMQVPPSATDCVSNGVMERQLETALR
jgi:hypothetical protein